VDQESTSQKVGNFFFYYPPILTLEVVLSHRLHRFKEINEAQEQLMGFMRSQIAEHKAEIALGSSSIKEGRNDVFTMLVRANEDEGGKFQLDDQELIGNVYILLLAGHGECYYYYLFALGMPRFELRTYQGIVETTGHTLAATLAFLALHNDIQEEVYEHITSVVGPDRDPVGVYVNYPGLPPLISTAVKGIQ